MGRLLNTQHRGRENPRCSPNPSGTVSLSNSVEVISVGAGLNTRWLLPWWRVQHGGYAHMAEEILRVASVAKLGPTSHLPQLQIEELGVRFGLVE